MLDVGAVLQIAGEVGKSAADMLKTLAGVKIVSDLYSRASRWREVRGAAAGAKELLGLRRPGEGVSYRHDSVHPLFAKGRELHPDNIAALRALGVDEVRAAARSGVLTVAPSIVTSLNDNLVLIGSPIAEGLSRAVFGYRELRAGSLELVNPPVDLPFRHVLSRNVIDTRAQALRYVAGKGRVSRANWQIESDSEMFVPGVRTVDRFLDFDYLLISRLRNFLSREALDEGKYIVSIAGCHGTGTRAIEVLLSDTSTLARIGQLLSKQPAAYQVLLKVGDIHHSARRGSRARQVELVGEPEVLTDRRERWEAAVKIADANLRQWIQGAERRA